jgi:VIT1/CCC1 family predicted Fe2+/Mn2+ transporter
MNLTDFIVTLFAVLVATVFLIITITAVLLALFSDKNVAPFFTIITDTMTTITAALVGYIAGRGVSRTETQ